MNKPCYLCVNKQDKERRILPEADAFDLDIRLWDIKVWNCCTMGHESSAIDKTSECKLLDISFAPAIPKCQGCGAYHFISEQVCTRPKHVRFDELMEGLTNG